MITRTILILLTILMTSCETKIKNTKITDNQMIGTWKLISATTIQGDSISTDDLSGKEMIKIINHSHFAFLNHDINKGQDSLVHFVAGGGKYTLKDDQYTEFLEYCNYREWEGHNFDFTVAIKDDTLIQSGIEKLEDLNVDRKIIEKYIRTSN